MNCPCISFPMSDNSFSLVAILRKDSGPCVSGARTVFSSSVDESFSSPKVSMYWARFESKSFLKLLSSLVLIPDGMVAYPKALICSTAKSIGFSDVAL